MGFGLAPADGRNLGKLAVNKRASRGQCRHDRQLRPLLGPLQTTSQLEHAGPPVRYFP